MVKCMVTSALKVVGNRAVRHITVVELEPKKSSTFLLLGVLLVLYGRLKIVFWGKYLDLRWGKQQCGGKNYIMRSFHYLYLFTNNFLGGNSPQWARASSFMRCLAHTDDASQSVGLLWTTDQPDAEIPTWQHTTFTTNIHVLGGIRAPNPSKQATADPCLRPRGRLG
jgi:hypothetical protein